MRTLILTLIIVGSILPNKSQARGDSHAELDQKLLRSIHLQGMRPLKRQEMKNPHLFRLGKALFEEKLLSGNKNISCQTCHHPQFGTGDDLPLPIGEGGEGDGPTRTMGKANVIPRNSPTVFGRGDSMLSHMMWDGRISFDRKTGAYDTPEAGLNGETPAHPEYTKVLTSSLDAQAMFPPTSHDEMRGQVGTNDIADAKDNFEVWEKLTARILNVKKYKKMLFRAYPRVRKSSTFNFAHIAKAISEFERVEFQAIDTPFDHYMRGKKATLSKREKRGAIAFLKKGSCVECHGGALMSDMKFHSVCYPQLGPGKEEDRDDKGRFLITGDDKDMYAFRTAPLRNVGLTAPYGHAGAFRTLKEVIEHYRNPKKTQDEFKPSFGKLPYQIKLESGHGEERTASMDKIVLKGIKLSDQEARDLEAFLKTSLTDFRH